jgi:hypothetical protein
MLCPLHGLFRHRTEAQRHPTANQDVGQIWSSIGRDMGIGIRPSSFIFEFDQLELVNDMKARVVSVVISCQAIHAYA